MRAMDASRRWSVDAPGVIFAYAKMTLTLTREYLAALRAWLQGVPSSVHAGS